MNVTFIAHSAYLVEWDKFYTLFDYTYEPDYTGELPELNPDKPLLVFASHSHEDHFDAKVFTLLEKYPDSRRANEVRNRLEVLEEMLQKWNSIVLSDNVRDFIDFKNSYTNPRLARICDIKIDSLDFVKAQTV